MLFFVSKTGKLIDSGTIASLKVTWRLQLLVLECMQELFSLSVPKYLCMCEQKQCIFHSHIESLTVCTAHPHPHCTVHV